MLILETSKCSQMLLIMSKKDGNWLVNEMKLRAIESNWM